jgi:hypothetical protein
MRVIDRLAVAMALHKENHHHRDDHENEKEPDDPAAMRVAADNRENDGT